MPPTEATSVQVVETGEVAGGPAGTPSDRAGVIRWLRRWPSATAVVIGVAVWFVTAAILDTAIPAARPASGMAGLLVGVVVGTGLAGLEGTWRWVVVPVLTLGVGIIVAGALLVAGLQVP